MKWVLPGAALVAALAFFGTHGLIQQSSSAKNRTSCSWSPRVSGQAIVEVEVDGSPSTDDARLRADYAQAASRVAGEAANRGAFLGLSVFGGSIAGIERICEMSTRTDGAAPLFATAQQTAVTQSLDKEALKASTTRSPVHQSDIYGALVDAIQHVQTLRRGEHVSAKVVIITDGDQAVEHVHLRLRLDETRSEGLIARQIIGPLPVPIARGVDVQIIGVGRSDLGRPASTITVRRMIRVWRLICVATQASNCQVSSDLS